MPKKIAKKKNEIVVSKQAAPVLVSSADALISQAISSKADIDTLERLMKLRGDVLAEQAKEAFNTSMAEFQSECPVISKTKGVKTKKGNTAYKYAPIECIVAQVKDCIKKHGFRYSTSMKFDNANGIVEVTCRVVHRLGHEEISVMPVPLGSKTEVMSQTQVVAAASTFAKRYAFLNAFGIMTGDEDNDTASERGDQVETEQSAPQSQSQSAAPAVQSPAPAPKTEQLPEGVRVSFNPKEPKPSKAAFDFAVDVWGTLMRKRGIEPGPQREKMLEAQLHRSYQVRTMAELRKRQCSDFIDVCIANADKAPPVSAAMGTLSSPDAPGPTTAPQTTEAPNTVPALAK